MNTYPPRPKSRDHLTQLFTVVIIALTLFAAPAMSQTNTFPPSGNVGVGTTSPSDTLQVGDSNTSGKSLRIQNGGGPSRSALMTIIGTTAGSGSQAWYTGVNVFATDGSYEVKNAGGSGLTFTTLGRVGIAANSPFDTLQVGDSGTSGKSLRIQNGGGPSRSALMTIIGTTAGSVDQAWYTGVNVFATDGSYEVKNAAGGGLLLDTSGSVSVSGNLNVSGNIAAKYQDWAEWVTATETMEPGTVVVLNPDKPNEVMPAARAYDTSVAGVVSAHPALILGEGAASKAQIATAGRVRVKASATRQPIHIGDLLVTSGKSGVAMKSEPMKIGGRAFHQPGTIIGKALEPLYSGEGEILVLLSLQ